MRLPAPMNCNATLLYLPSLARSPCDSLAHPPSFLTTPEPASQQASLAERSRHKPVLLPPAPPSLQAKTMKLSVLLLLILTGFSLTFLGLFCNALPLLYPFSSGLQPRPGRPSLGVDSEERLSGEVGAVEASTTSILDAALDSLSWPGLPFLLHCGTSPRVHDSARNRQTVFLEIQAPITAGTSVPTSRGRRGDSVKRPSWLAFLIKRGG